VSKPNQEMKERFNLSFMISHVDHLYGHVINLLNLFVFIWGWLVEEEVDMEW